MRLEWKPDEQTDVSPGGTNSPGAANSPGITNSPGSDDAESMQPVTDLSSGTEKAIHPMKGMTGKQKIKYLLTYYGLKTFAIIALVGVITALIVNYFTYKEAALKILMVNHSMDDTSELAETFDDYLKENDYRANDFAEVNSEIQFTFHDQATDYMDIQSFQIAVATKEYSAFFCDEEIFSAYANEEYTRNLHLLLTDEQYEYFEENDLIIYGKTYETEESYPAGIILTKDNCNWLKLTNYDTCCYGVLFGNMSDDEAYRLTQYILNY